MKYTYPEQYGIAEVSYIFCGGRWFQLENGLPIMVDDLKPNMRLRSKHGMVINVVGVQCLYEPPEPPSTDENGRTLSRVIGTVKHKANTVMDLTWSYCTTTSTPDHRYYSVSRQAYVPASDLRPGELLRTDTGAVTPVQAVGPKRFGLIEVYNLEIEHFHNYYVGAGESVLVHNGTCVTQPMDAELAEELPESVLYRIVRGDAKGRSFGTPRNPDVPSIGEFNPRVADVAASDISELVVGGKHGIFPEQAESISQLTNEELTAFRIQDPISAVQVENGLSLTGGHHRINEIIQRVQSAQLDPSTLIRILVHD